jgi:hypothetical protein
MARILKGEIVDLGLSYFRTTPRFETASPNYQWLTPAAVPGDRRAVSRARRNSSL